MLLQLRERTIRAIRQHDHALLSGRLAHAWRGVGGSPRPLPFHVVVATALHDVGWIELDAEPRFDPETGRPHDFESHPDEEKLRMYRRGIEEVCRVDPRSGILASLHYTTFSGTEGVEPLQTQERERREALARELGLDAAAEAALSGGLRHVKLLDRLSLLVCLGPPDARPESMPGWLDPGTLRAPGEEEALRVTWRAPDECAVEPFPFRERVVAEVPYTELPALRFPDAASFARAWTEARRGRWRVTVGPGRGRREDGDGETGTDEARMPSERETEEDR